MVTADITQLKAIRYIKKHIYITTAKSLLSKMQKQVQFVKLNFNEDK